MVVPPMVSRKRRMSRLVNGGAGILIFLLVLLMSYALWTVYENTLTLAAALDQGSATTTKPAHPR